MSSRIDQPDENFLNDEQVDNTSGPEKSLSDSDSIDEVSFDKIQYMNTAEYKDWLNYFYFAQNPKILK